MNFDTVIAERKNKTVYRDGNKAIKVFNKDFSKTDVLSQALNQARVEETGLKIPKMLEVTTENGNWVIVSEYIEGKTLETLMNEHPEKEDYYLNLFVDLQISVHGKRASGLINLKDKMYNKISVSKLDDSMKYELHTRLQGMPTHKKLCHGDFNPSNIIVNANGDMYIIDWSHVTQGNASADVARTYLLFCLAGKQETAEKYIKMFCQKTNTSLSYVQKWLPIVSASQSVKNKEHEKELLSKWVDVIEYQ